MKRILLHVVIATSLLGCTAKEGPESSESSQGDVQLFGKSDSPFDSPFGFDGSLDWDEVAKRCGAPTDDEPVVYQSDFEWGYTIEDMGRRFDDMYASGKRLKDRAYYDEASGRFVMPVQASWGGQVVVPTRLLENVRMHIEKALAQGYAEYIFFPDMGHTHFFIPRDHWDSVYLDYSAQDYGQMFSQLFDDPELKVLYHTAEQLTQLDDDDNLLSDRHLQWRFFTRNVVGDNDWAGRIDLLHEPGSMANTARSLEGHRYFGAGFNITATKDGCFPYVHNGWLFYFDISMTDLPYETSDDAVDFF
jgi:hypothetical protein